MVRTMPTRAFPAYQSFFPPWVGDGYNQVMHRASHVLLAVGFLAMLAGAVIVMGAEGSGPPPSLSESRHSKIVGSTVFASGVVVAIGSAVALYVRDRKRGQP